MCKGLGGGTKGCEWREGNKGKDEARKEGKDGVVRNGKGER